jgi:Rrf2 family protein
MWRLRKDVRVRLTQQADYAIRAMAELAVRGATAPATTAELAEAQEIPRAFLGSIMSRLCHAGLVASQRGPEGGYRLVRAARDITLAEIIRAIEGPLAMVGDQRPGEMSYRGPAELLVLVWIAVRANLRTVLERVTLADLATGRLPRSVTRLSDDPANWDPH